MKISRLAFLLSLSVLFDCSLILYRNFHINGYWKNLHQFDDLLVSGRGYGFLFLFFNLFLAWIPYGLSLIIRTKQAPALKYGLLLAWLLFFPNAPYIITDFIHLELRPSVPLWYDMLVLFSFAWTGLIFGYLSLLRVQKVLMQDWGISISKGLGLIAISLAGLGIYVGRFLRWNSWDVVMQPEQLLADLTSIVTNPSIHWPAMGAGILLSVLLLLSYSTLQAIKP